MLGLNILHLLADCTAALIKVRQLLKPGGVFVSSTACLGHWLAWIGIVAPLGSWLGLMPPVQVFTARDLKEQLSGAGFAIVRDWLPSEKEAVFIVAKAV